MSRELKVIAAIHFVVFTYLYIRGDRWAATVVAAIPMAIYLVLLVLLAAVHSSKRRRVG